MEPGIQPSKFIQVSSDQWEIIQSASITESAVSLTVNGVVWLTFMCTPVDLEALAAGFLFNEGLIQARQDIADIRVCPDNENIDVWLNQGIQKPDLWRRTSGCTGGVTRISNSDSDEKPVFPLTNGGVITAGQINHLVGQLYQEQTLYRQSGGVHTSAISDGNQLCLVAEDVGRHNTLDKLAGKLLFQDSILSRRIILTTGRISSEMLQKAYRLVAPVVISRTAATSLSIEMAQQWGMTLIGYARRDRFNIYTHSERVLQSHLLSIEEVQHAKTNL